MSFFICSNCGYGSASWLGKCPDCGEFNTLAKHEEETSKKNEAVKKITLKSFKDIKPLSKGRLVTGIYEFDRVTGGGMIPGEVLLLSGEPGVGKSTLLLQSLKKFRTVYISGEEAAEQVKERAERLKIPLTNLLFSDDLQIEGITTGIEDMDEKPDILVVDSIQTVYTKTVDSPPGNVSQLRECANLLTTFAKKNKITVLIVGHITKGGDIAGPKTLEHIVDCVLNFEGERVSQFRILRASKNRFGSTDEIGIFQMEQGGLIEVSNPLVFLEDQGNVPGKAIVGVSEGKRPLFFEVQALSVPSMLAIPRRVVNGVDYNKIMLLLAVMRKHLNISLDKYDIYVNVVGGVSIKSPSSDLGIIAAILSSVRNMPVGKNVLFIGEVGLLGEVRKNFVDSKVLSEAKRLKFKSIYSSHTISNISALKGVFKSS